MAPCHAIPDPSQHTVKEGPGVVQRMKGHMEYMDKQVPDEKTLKEIAMQVPSPYDGEE